MGRVPPPTLPPCHMRSDAIGAIYAGRFTAITWQDFDAAGVAFAGDGWPEVLARLQSVSWHDSDNTDRQAAQRDFQALLIHAKGRLREEVEHHRLLGSQPLWGFLNGVGLVERLHINHFELALARGERTARSALGHAFRCHLARRAIYRALFPVVEALHAAAEALQVRRPERFLSVFGTAYGDDAEDLARVVVACVHRGDTLAHIQTRIGSVLRPSTFAHDPWTLFTAGIHGFLDTESNPVAEAARSALHGAHPDADPERRWSIVGFLLWYFSRGNLGLLFGLMRPRLILAYTRALLPVAAHLLRPAPYASQSGDAMGDLPGMWTFAGAGARGLILDPAALISGASFAHPGLENSNPLLPHGTAAESGYAIDQYILRRLTETLADPDGVWSARLEDFVLRWTQCERGAGGGVVGTLHAIDDDVCGIAAMLHECANDAELRRGLFPEAAWPMFLGARAALMRAVEDEWRTHKNGPLATMLGAYYLHGL